MIQGLFGNRCLVCELKLNKREFLGLCPICEERLYASKAIHSLEMEFRQRFPYHNKFTDIRILFPMYENADIKKIIHAFKYQYRPQLAVSCGKILGETFKDIRCDYVIPVPVHRIRRLERGYNQAEKIVEGILASHTESKVIRLRRNKYTRTQTKLSKHKRTRNVDHVFSLSEVYDLSNKSIVIVDDVITTGSTLHGILDLLENLSPKHLYFAAIAMSM